MQKSNRSGRPGSASGMMMSGFGNVSGAGSDGSMGRPGTAESTHGGGGGGGSRPGTAGSSRMGAGTADRYRETVERLKKLLDKERKTLRTVRAAFATQMQVRNSFMTAYSCAAAVGLQLSRRHWSLQSRTELEGFLADCIRDVRQELQRQRALGSAGPGGRHGRGAGGNRMSSNESLGGGGGGALDEFGPSEREQVVEMLLSQVCRRASSPSVSLLPVCARCCASACLCVAASVCLSMRFERGEMLCALRFSLFLRSGWSSCSTQRRSRTPRTPLTRTQPPTAPVRVSARGGVMCVCVWDLLFQSHLC